jgi:group I intron endonuclease
MLRNGTHHSRAFQNAANKYGVHNIRVEILESDLPVELLIEREQVWLDKFAGELYNRSPTAASRLGAKMSPEARAKISASLKGNQYRKGIKHSPEIREVIGNAVRLANAEGRRRQPAPRPENLSAHNAAIRAGTKQHASKKPEQDAAIVAAFNGGMRLKEIGKKFDMTPSAAGYAIRRVLKTPKGKWSKRCRPHIQAMQ